MDLVGSSLGRDNFGIINNNKFDLILNQIFFDKGCAVNLLPTPDNDEQLNLSHKQEIICHRLSIRVTFVRDIHVDSIIHN